jgi:hypothetical protein
MSELYSGSAQTSASVMAYFETISADIGFVRLRVWLCFRRLLYPFRPRLDRCLALLHSKTAAQP